MLSVFQPCCWHARLATPPLLFCLVCKSKANTDTFSAFLRSGVVVFFVFPCPYFPTIHTQAIELGNIPETLPSLSGSSRWSLGSLSLLPASTAPTSVSVSCMSDDAKGEPETKVRRRIE